MFKFNGRWYFMNKSMTLVQIAESIRRFILENYLFGIDSDELSDNSSFLDLGILDSLGILELIGFIEKEFGINVADTEILPENLDSVEFATSFVSRKTGHGGS
ncbi:MAG: acyl carrier protein [Bacillota bacterium]